MGYVPPQSPVKPAVGAKMIKRYFENKLNGSYKFWEVSYPEVLGTEEYWCVRWGRIGTKGQTQTHAEYSPLSARSKAMALVNTKIKTGYIEAVSHVEYGKPIIKIGPALLLSKGAGVAPIPDHLKVAALAMIEAGVKDDVIYNSLGLSRGQISVLRAEQTIVNPPPGSPGPMPGKTGRQFDWEDQS